MHRLEKTLLADAGEREARLVEGFRAFSRCSDANGRERMADRGKEARLLGQRAGVRDHREGVHLQVVVIMEAHGLVHAHTGIQLEASLLQTFAAARVAAVQDGHIVFTRQHVDRGEETPEVGLRVDVLLSVGGEQHVFLGLEAELGEYAAGLDLVQVRAQHLRHGASRDVGALRGAAGVLEVAAGVLGVG